jgi:hypothetical protein
MLFYYLYAFPKCNSILDLFCKKEWFWIIPRTIFVGFAIYSYRKITCRGISVALVLSLPAAYEYKELFVTLIVYLIGINLVLNPILLSKYMKKAKL